MKYVKARAEMMLFDNSDVVTASALGEGEWNQGELDKEEDFFCDAVKNHVEKNF